MNTQTLRLMLLGSLAGFLTGFSPLWARTKTDILYMKNGDRITCEIKGMEHGQISVKTPYTKGTLTINWEKVERIESKQLFVLETEKGNYYSGELQTNAQDNRNVDVTEAGTRTTLQQGKVVHIEQLGRGFIGRMKGAVDYGFTFAKSNNQTQSTLHLDLNSRTEESYTTFAADSLFSTTGGVDTNRHTGSSSYSHRLRSANWSLTTFGSFLNSDQQQLDLRTIVGGGIERRFAYSNRKNLIGAAAIVYTREKYESIDRRPKPVQQRGSRARRQVLYVPVRFDRVDKLAVDLSQHHQSRSRAQFIRQQFVSRPGG